MCLSSCILCMHLTHISSLCVCALVDAIAAQFDLLDAKMPSQSPSLYQIFLYPTTDRILYNDSTMALIHSMLHFMNSLFKQMKYAFNWSNIYIRTANIKERRWAQRKNDQEDIKCSKKSISSNCFVLNLFFLCKIYLSYWTERWYDLCRFFTITVEITQIKQHGIR